MPLLCARSPCALFLHMIGMMLDGRWCAWPSDARPHTACSYIATSDVRCEGGTAGHDPSTELVPPFVNLCSPLCIFGNPMAWCVCIRPPASQTFVV